ncbi:major facilitator superfamily domain-containing protein 2B isoform X3 [Neophocaena asiaeorientalis asiaeorientalis]|uniref:Major facilitator superfamily domain-containing protein 2B isoform X3 n=1 Tax=Neophocaena asiaeorientalis asiaeorientalis TaxID=1706337 RepID=A0A341D0W6_NEOAA|nr:major facilitator superfamily domain-containing protein 2B isoform X3 [Neophocaena asiaeorientalis asiaeorientalis]
MQVFIDLSLTWWHRAGQTFQESLPWPWGSRNAARLSWVYWKVSQRCDLPVPPGSRNREWHNPATKCPSLYSWLPPRPRPPRALHGSHPESPSPGLLQGPRAGTQRGEVAPGPACASSVLVPRGAPPGLCFHRVLGCTPFIALASFFLWFLPPFTSLRGLWYTALYSLFQALATFFQVPYTALTMLLTPSPRERDSATVYRMTLEMAGTLMGATVHGLIVSGAHGSHRCKETALPGQVAVSPNATRLYSIAATVVAVTYPVCSSLLCLGVKERPGASARAAGQGLSFLAGLRLTVRHPPYLKLVISFLFISAAVQVEQSYLVLFCAHASRLHDHVQSLVLTILVSAVLSTPMWEWVLQRFGKRMAAFGIFGMVPFAILLAAMPTAPVAYVVAFVSGVSIAVSLLLPWSMLPDVVDEFQRQHQHGPGLETIFYSSYVFFTKLSGAGALGISTLSLERTSYSLA